MARKTLSGLILRNQLVTVLRHMLRRDRAVSCAHMCSNACRLLQWWSCVISGLNQSPDADIYRRDDLCICPINPQGQSDLSIGDLSILDFVVTLSSKVS